MAKLGISTGTVPNDGMGDSLLDGAIKINSNFNEIYNYFGNGTNLTAIGGTWVTTSVGIHTLKNVGIGTTNPTSTLTVGGNVTISGILTSSSAQLSLLSGTNSNYSGVSTVGSLSIGSSQVISSGRELQNILSLDAATIATIESAIQSAPNNFNSLNVSGVSTLGNTVVGGATTQLIVNGDARITGILTIGSSSITLNGSSNTINVGSGITLNGSTGIISATSIFINGSSITGLGVTYITAGTGISVSQNTGNVTITATGGVGGGESYWTSTTAGIHTLSNAGIGTTNPTSKLTVKGNTSLETLNVSGVSTFNGGTYYNSPVYYSNNPTRAYFGSLNEMSIYSTGTFTGKSYNFIDANSGYLDIRNLRTTIRNPETFTQRDLAVFDANTFDAEFVKLYYGGNEKFATVGAGVTVTGTTFTNQLSVSGVSTFSGNVRVGVNTSSGVILTSPNGTQYRLIVDDAGALSTVAV